ncbi:MAG TPA: hypothetical protein ENN81_10250, partial [Phycisphaerales bacterium]|nr:hypothetical protein [Phycisphaerales bacterium]
MLARDLPARLATSRRILLAQRPPGDATCITQQLQGNQVVLQGSSDGGPGLRFMAFYNEAPDDPLALFDWSQHRLRPFLENEQKANAPVLRQVEWVADMARQCAADIREGSMPSRSDIPAVPHDTTAWPAQCMARLVEALEDAPNAALVWAEELAAATAALADHHRWLDLLLQSHLSSLEFQASCRDAFEYAQANAHSGGEAQVSNLPATGTAVTYGQNYLEVERQAEQTFCATPAMTSLAVYHDLSDAPAARFMPPEQRGAFLWLRSRLTPGGQRVWDLAATSPCTQSRLIAILYRAVLSGTLDAAALVLQRLDRTNPNPSVDEMVDSLFYRAGFNSSGFNWADRYDHRLLDAAGQILGPGDTVIRRARQTVNNLLDGWRNYAGDIMTLKQALDARKFDCVRGTDLIGAIYRNAGHGRYYIGRLNCGVAGHSVGVVPIEEDGRQRLLIADSLE